MHKDKGKIDKKNLGMNFYQPARAGPSSSPRSAFAPRPLWDAKTRVHRRHLLEWKTDQVSPPAHGGRVASPLPVAPYAA